MFQQVPEPQTAAKNRLHIDIIVGDEIASEVGRLVELGASKITELVEEVGTSYKPDHCKYCAVAEVCRRDDTAFRRRLVEWMVKEDPGGGPAESAARGLWRLGAPVKDES